MLNDEVNDEWCYVVMLNSMSKLALARVAICFSIVFSSLFGIQFSIQHSAFSIAKDHR
jgi:hypothetical protein